MIFSCVLVLTFNSRLVFGASLTTYSKPTALSNQKHVGIAGVIPGVVDQVQKKVVARWTNEKHTLMNQSQPATNKYRNMHLPAFPSHMRAIPPSPPPLSASGMPTDMDMVSRATATSYATARRHVRTPGIDGSLAGVDMTPTALSSQSSHEHIGTLGIDGGAAGELMDAVAGAVDQVQKKVDASWASHEPSHKNQLAAKKPFEQSEHAIHLNSSTHVTNLSHWGSRSHPASKNQSDPLESKHPSRKHLNQTQKHLNQTQAATKEQVSGEHQKQSGWWETATQWWAGNQSQPTVNKPSHEVSVKETRNQSNWWDWATGWWTPAPSAKDQFVKKHLNQSQAAAGNHSQLAVKEPSDKEHRNETGWWEWTTQWWGRQPNQSKPGVQNQLRSSSSSLHSGHRNETGWWEWATGLR